MNLLTTIQVAVAFIYLFSTSDALCQDSERQADIARMAEDLIGTPEEESIESSYEGLIQALSRPLNLNGGSLDALVSLGILSLEQTRSIQTYRSKYGDFVSVYELQAVSELSMETIEKLRPFVTVTAQTASVDKRLIQRIRNESDSYLITRISRKWANTTDDHPLYSGSPEHMLLRFRSQRSGDFSFGFTTEKDSGEPMKWDTNNRYYGFDRWSFHAQLQNKGAIKNLIIGDMQAQFGQGLVFGGAFGPGKGAETITTMRRANVGLLPYTSSYEAGNMRGLGLTLALSGKLELSVLCSRTHRDATIERLKDQTVIRSLQKSGLHRTNSELLARQQVGDTQLGLALIRRQGALEAGLLVDHSVFSLPINPDPTPYNQFALQGKTLSHAGVFFNYNIGRFSTFGELAIMPGQRGGLVAGVLGSITPRLDVALLIRNYAPEFQSRFTNAISENSTPTNERGVYLGWRYQFNRKVSLTGYVDLFTFPWLRYRAYAPSYGNEWLWRLAYQPSRNMMMFIQGRRESKSRNLPVDALTYLQIEGVKHNYWVHVETGLREQVRFRTKLQMSRFSENGTLSRGIALSQDVKFEIQSVSGCSPLCDIRY
ncbi:MAG: helix-hairpin-helix domain-containing protein [Chryseolinea sp.]